MSATENTALFRRMIEEFWNQRKLDTAGQFFAADHTSPSVPALPPGPESVRSIASSFLTAFPDLKVEIEMSLAEDDLVGGRLRQTGTHTGPLVSPQGSIPPSGKAVNFTEVALLRVRDGKFVTSWYWTDMLSMLQQIGAIPAAPGARG